MKKQPLDISIEKAPIGIGQSKLPLVPHPAHTTAVQARPTLWQVQLAIYQGLRNAAQNSS